MQLGFDLIFFAIIGASAVGGFFLGEEKSQRLMIGVICGSFAASIFAENLYKLMGTKTSAINQTIIGIAVIGLCAVLSVMAKNLRDPKWPKSKVKAAVFATLSALAGVAYAISSMSDQSIKSLTTEHNLAALAYDLRTYLMGALILALLVSFWTVGKAKK